MAMDKKQIALTVGGILAGLALTYLLYRLEQKNSAASAAAQTEAAAEAESELANQQQQIASLPSITVPTISSTPSTTDTTNQATAPADDSTLESIIAAFQSNDNSDVTNASNPIATIAPLPIPTAANIPPVIVSSVNTFNTTPVTSSASNPNNTLTFNHISTTGS